LPEQGITPVQNYKGLERKAKCNLFLMLPNKEEEKNGSRDHLVPSWILGKNGNIFRDAL
jgi:hypothetical protein